MKINFCISFFFFVSFSIVAQTAMWKELDKGLSLAILNAPVKSLLGDSKITILKIDPEYFEFDLVCASEKKFELLTRPLDVWAKEQKFIAAINAGMFDGNDATQPNLAGITNRGYTKDFDHYNNTQATKDKMVICFNPKDSTVPRFRIADIENCENFELLKKKYNTLIQGIRMIDCKQKNRWFIDQKIWSICVMGMDKDGNALFIHCRSPYTMYNFTNMILKMPLNIKTMIYLEGGPESSFYLSTNTTKIRQVGSYETGFNPDDKNNRFWQIANVVGIRKRK